MKSCLEKNGESKRVVPVCHGIFLFLCLLFLIQEDAHACRPIPIMKGGKYRGCTVEDGGRTLKYDSNLPLHLCLSYCRGRDDVIRELIEDQRVINQKLEELSIDQKGLLGSGESKCDDVGERYKHPVDPSVKHLVNLRSASTKVVLSSADAEVVEDYWKNRKRMKSPADLLGVQREPVSVHVDADSDELPPVDPSGNSVNADEDKKTSLGKSMYGDPQDIVAVMNRDTKLLAQGVEYQKGGVANLVDIMLSGFVHGLVGPMSRTALDSSYSSLLHGPYWVILDKKKASSKTDLLKKSEEGPFYADDSHLAYLVPNEKYGQVIDALKGANRMGMISHKEFMKLGSRVISFDDYFQIGSLDEPLDENTLKAYLQKNGGKHLRTYLEGHKR